MSTSDDKPVKHVQSVDVDANGFVYKHSDGDYANVYYPNSGLIIADDYLSPEHRAAWITEQGMPYVKLKQWSDIAFLYWQQECSVAGTSVSNLEAVIRFSISNTDAGNVISQIIGGQTIGEPNFNALLGTPNGSGVAWLLINHKAQMGLKTISSISLFRPKESLGGAPVTNIAFEVVDYSPS